MFFRVTDSPPLPPPLHRPTRNRSKYARRPSRARATFHSRPTSSFRSHDYHCTPIWTSADDEKLRTAVYDPESLTKLLQKLEEGTMADLSKKADGDSEGPWLNAGASYSKRSREEGDDEELQD